MYFHNSVIIGYGIDDILYKWTTHRYFNFRSKTTFVFPSIGILCLVGLWCISSELKVTKANLIFRSNKTTSLPITHHEHIIFDKIL